MLSKLRGSCLNLLLKLMLFTFGAAMVLILIVCSIPFLFIDLLMGNYNMDECINDKYGLPVNHFND